mmetsp:Transcript_11982/g.32457  ORF Transcript_11982/g.32457 Transcript_11982/m.32457 type:complete len:626 (-) Transcript_11982:541-2418(-)|eukprot:CAMPEP_0113879390 /NCGR_PEP_ID=MMETSP0780_2-20120614/7215_1 /TAXON_ID=652834 /ORGANISM="Palpitomonas bilix" /LENGTH=625 /DNA_ID=CAMNT_0000865973 /DNA_START=381 /DNA_END=2258 /DNA_ORIENTATION=- /assembly_acc=CAM_ASM_000599
MLVTLDLLLSKVASNPNTLQRLGKDELKQVWMSLVEYVRRQLSAGKGVTIKEFGSFSFVTEVRDGANGQAKGTVKRPVFNVSERLLRAADLVAKRVSTPGSVPSTQLNAMSMVETAGTTKDIITAAVKDILRALYESLRDGFPVSVDFKGLGKFVADKGTAGFRFGRSFLDAVGAPPRTAPRTPGGAFQQRPPSSRGGSHPVDVMSVHADKNVESRRVPPLQKRPSSRPGTSGSGRNGAASARPSSSHKAMQLVSELKRESNVPEMNVRSISARPPTHDSDDEHEELDLHTVYGQQIKEREEKKKKEQAEAERLMNEAVERSNQLLQRELTEAEQRKKQRAEIDAFNKKIMRKHMSKRQEKEKQRLEQGRPKNVGSEERNGAEVEDPEVLSDIFAKRKEPVLMSMNPRQLQEELKRQMAVKMEIKRREREADRRYYEETASKALHDLEKEKAVLNESKLDRFRKRREELDDQIRHRKAPLPAAVGNAVTEKLPRPDDTESVARRRDLAKRIMAEQLAYAEEKKEIERQRRELERLTADEEIRKTQAELDEEVKHSHSQRETLKQSLRSSWETQKVAKAVKPPVEVEGTSLPGVKYFEPPKSKTFGVMKSSIPKKFVKPKKQGGWV